LCVRDGARAPGVEIERLAIDLQREPRRTAIAISCEQHHGQLADVRHAELKVAWRVHLSVPEHSRVAHGRVSRRGVGHRRVGHEGVGHRRVGFRLITVGCAGAVRAALTAGQLARYAQFFSFGTNDLTQTTFAISRDDAEKSFLVEYIERGILSENPFASIDEEGVGRLMAIAVEDGRAAREGMEIGICGEHGGDPKSIAFCHRLGLSYVSCSPFRVPIARLAAAQAALREQGHSSK